MVLRRVYWFYKGSIVSRFGCFGFLDLLVGPSTFDKGCVVDHH